jgi:hypothetical protein
MDIHPMQGLDHSGNMLIVICRRKSLINADLYSHPLRRAAAGRQPEV